MAPASNGLSRRRRVGAGLLLRAGLEIIGVMNRTRFIFGGRAGACAFALVCCSLLVAAALCRDGHPSTSQAAAKEAKPDRLSSTDGRQLFASRCAGCHGLDGRGGERAPDIATTAKTLGRPDEELFRIIEKGVPGSGMPAFGSLGREGIKSIVAHLKSLQGRTTVAALPGDGPKGRVTFYGKARCAECHMVAGAGGFIAGDLTAYSANKSVDAIRDAIVKPGNAVRPGGRVSLSTRDGRSFSGVIRNEDNFSVQVQTLDGAFHLFEKTDLGTFERLAEPLMPTNYGSTLSAAELNDLISFLMSAARQANAGAGEKKAAHGDDEEYED